MDKFDRFQLLHRIFQSRRLPVSIKTLSEKLECSEKTVKRCIVQMRDQLDAPIVYFLEKKGWQYDGEGSELFQLPGLWLTSGELQSLALLMHVLDGVGKGLLNEELSVVDKQINRLLQARGISRSAFDEHIKVLPLANRQMDNKTFALVSASLLHGKQICIHYTSYTHQRTQRTVSAQNLVYYRENWYLDAWCHLRNDLRTFSLARIEKCFATEIAAKNIEQEQLRAHFNKSYGIFAGQAKHTARLRFSPEIAREIALQRWHPEQAGEWDGNDYLLCFPYDDDRELIQDILRHVPNVYVESPVKLRRAIQSRLQAGLELYSGKRIRRP